MGYEQPKDMNERVVQAARRVLDVKGFVSPIELLLQMQLLAPSNLRVWEKGVGDYLQSHIQGSPEKLARAFAIFADWARAERLVPIKASLRAPARDQAHELQVTADGNPRMEEFFRTYYAAADTPPRKLEALANKLNKPPELAVFMTVSDTATCAECGAEIAQGGFLFREKEASLCLACADLNHLEFLASGDAALSRRARKHSGLAAVVLQFNRRAKRYERRGILVTAEAIGRAEQECLSDADRRAAQRERGAERRTQEDAEFVRDMAAAICRLYPGCPPGEAADLAAHAGRRSSGRVGRSAAGRQLHEEALRLAVVAHIRHAHTRYDELLMTGAGRQDARSAIAAEIDEVLARWKGLGP